MEKGGSLPNRGRGRGRRKACNECKQHKLRCDIVQTPADACSRCRRLKIECKVEPSFQRISRRKRNADLENEVASLRQRLATSSSNEISQEVEEPVLGSTSVPDSAALNQAITPRRSIEPSALATPLTLLTEASAISTGENIWRLEDVSLPAPKVTELFGLFFKYYHPFLPLLDPEKSPLSYLQSCPLQAWTIICIASRQDLTHSGLLSTLSGPFTRLMWATLNGIPQDYNVIKAICLLCTWPLPTTSQRADPTFVLSGLMMQISMQLGLHRPVRSEEFTTLYVGHGEAVKDRLQTWFVCNIVAQNVATGYGQPPGTIYDWALEPAVLQDADYYPSEDLQVRFHIEKFCDHVSRSLYNSRPDPENFISTEKLLIVQLLENELKEIELRFRSISHINSIHLRAAELHLRCFVFLGSNAKNEDFTKLFIAATSFLTQVLGLESSGQIGHATNYILQMIVSAAFALLKILKSPFRHQIDFDYGKLLFNGSISALRRTSIMKKDRPARLADVLAQMWNADGTPGQTSVDSDSLQLKIRCRMSMSHVFDTVWRWRHRFRRGVAATGAQSADRPTELQVRGANQLHGILEDPTVIYPPEFGVPFLDEAGFSEVFDSLNWVFDDFPDGLGASQAGGM
ncbi:hypothetical protein BJY04DRAFT_190374 [Aspergillus karnatakaensis]|uniref:uncharacterized protein n=1 Tax=Aspergillus karnatakaensis TaxID=1810916 RepID=UPI003CCD8ADA